MKKLFKVAALSTAFALAGFANANDKIGFADAGYLMQNHPLTLEAASKFEKFAKNNTQFDGEEKKLAEEDKKLAEENKTLTAERSKLEADAKKLKAEQGTVEASLKKKVAALEKEAPRLRSKEIQARQNAINAEAKAFQNKVEALQKREAEFSKKGQAFQKKVEAFQKKAQDFQAKINKANKDAGGLDPVAVQKQVVDEINAAIKEVADEKGYTLVFQPASGMVVYAKDESADITEVVLEKLKAKSKVGGSAPKAEAKSDEKKEEATPATSEKSEAPKAEEVKPEEAKK